jgi:multidrug transporter EmrE-like cation transporter
MNAGSLLLALVSITLSAFAQITFKLGVSQPAVQAVLAQAKTAPWYSTASGLLLSPAVLGGFALYGVSAILWLVVLSKVDVSVAYPFVAVGFLVTMVAGAVLFDEPVGLVRVVGTLLVCAGVILVAGTKAS